MLGTREIILIVLVVLLLFGGKKIPELMRGLGRGVKSFKEGMNGVDDDSDKKEAAISSKDAATSSKDAATSSKDAAAEKKASDEDR